MIRALVVALLFAGCVGSNDSVSDKEPAGVASDEPIVASDEPIMNTASTGQLVEYDAANRILTVRQPIGPQTLDALQNDRTGMTLQAGGPLLRFGELEVTSVRLAGDVEEVTYLVITQPSTP